MDWNPDNSVWHHNVRLALLLLSWPVDNNIVHQKHQNNVSFSLKRFVSRPFIHLMSTYWMPTMCQPCCSVRETHQRNIWAYPRWEVGLCFWHCNPMALSHHPDGHLAPSSEPLCWSFFFIWIFLWLAPSHHWNLRSQCQLFREGFSDLSVKSVSHTPCHFFMLTCFLICNSLYLFMHVYSYISMHVCFISWTPLH